MDQKELNQNQYQNQIQVQPLYVQKDGDKFMEHTHSDDNTFYNWILSALVAFFYMIETASPDAIYTWVFRGLTLLSLILMIIINWKKAWHTLFPKKEKR